MTPLVAACLTAALLLASAFFVATEFALVAARQHRLEQAAAVGRRGAKAALNGIRELSLMLAGAQLGITMVVVGLGMVSEPAFHRVLEPPLSAMGLPATTTDVIALAVALIVITFLHVVVGEMAPKSWAIAHPERSAMLLSPPFRAYTATMRWLLVLLNGMTTMLLRLVRVSPRNDVVTVRNREQIHQLVRESRRLGLIGDNDHGLLTRALRAPERPVRTVMAPVAQVAEVPASAGPQRVIDIGRRSGHTRLVVRDKQGAVVGAVHVRGALITRHAGDRWTAGAAALPVPLIHIDADLAQAAELLRNARSQIGIVIHADGTEAGLVSMDDVLVAVLVS
jgi:CBS domain containing-hemolysin-like protein